MTTNRAVPVFAWSIVLTIMAATEAEGDDPPTGKLSVPEIVERVRDRQRKIVSARFTWKEQGFEAKGSQGNLAPQSRKEGAKARPVTPPEDQHYVLLQTFSFEGSRTNHGGSFRAFNSDGLPYRHVSRSTYDGEIQLLLQQPTPERKALLGLILVPKGKAHLNLMILEPLVHCYRLGDAALMGSSDLQGYRLEAELSEIDGVRCVLLAGESGTRRLWLDPRRDYRIVRSEFQQDGVLQRRTEFDYVDDLRHGWALCGWKIIQYGIDGGIASSRTAKVTRYEINPKLDADEFTLDFPEGTQIQDRRPRKLRVAEQQLEADEE